MSKLRRSDAAQAGDIVNGDWSVKTLQGEFADCNDLHKGLYFRNQARRDQYLAVRRLSAKTRGEVADVTNGAVVEPLFEADRGPSRRAHSTSAYPPVR